MESTHDQTRVKTKENYPPAGTALPNRPAPSPPLFRQACRPFVLRIYPADAPVCKQQAPVSPQILGSARETPQGSQLARFPQKAPAPYHSPHPRSRGRRGGRRGAGTGPVRPRKMHKSL
jgi:hypothetical protein